MELVLVSGRGGSGVSTVARGVAHALRERGYSTAEITSAVAAPVAASPVWADLADTFGVWLTGLGAAALVPDELVGLTGLNELVTGALVADAVADPGIDVVVWDLGSSREALRTLQLLDSIPMLLEHLLTGQAADQLSAPDPDALVAAWYRLVAHVTTARTVVRSAACVLVGTCDDAELLFGDAGLMRLYDCAPAAVVLTKVPAQATGREAEEVTQAMLAADRIGAPVVQLRRRRPARITSAKTAKELAPLVAVLASMPAVKEHSWTLTHRKDQYRLAFPLREGAEVRVGRRGDVLLLVCDGHRRQFELPPVLKRCILDGGGMRGGDLVLRFSPDPRVWRERT
ncbi:MAG: hypothetical protein PHU75_04230 [Candidatus Nanopelagicales bacterium]|nr:hypothetical protein [Candidatus Nanopelagicales bacterium]